MKPTLSLTLLTSLTLFAEEPTQAPQAATKDAPTHTSLFDGESMAGWLDKNGDPAEEGKWTAADGVLTRVQKGAGQLYSEKEFGDFDLVFEWKIEKGSNSGVKYRLQDIDGQKLGLEYQILDDDNHADNKHEDHRTGSLYDLKPPIENKPLKPVGEWNSSRILVKEGLVQHYLNDVLIVEMKIPSPEWEAAYEQSKYKKYKGFGVNPKGRLLLQDHGDFVAFRNIKILEF